MKFDVVLLPSDLAGRPLRNKTVVVLDVIRATTTIAAALDAGIRDIRAFAELSQARSAADGQSPRPILCGEVKALPAPGFDLGNSPRQFTAEHAGRQMILCTTNGTKALAAAQSAAALFAGALVNASAVARAVAATGRDVLMLCAGSDGTFSIEDVIGAGAICHALERAGYQSESDTARMSIRLFTGAKDSLPAVLHDTRAGRAVIRAGLEPDIDFAARLNALQVVGIVDTEKLLICPAK